MKTGTLVTCLLVNVHANLGFSSLFVLELGVRNPHRIDRRTDGRTDGRARHVLRPIRTAAQVVDVGVMYDQVHVFTLRNEDRYLAWDFAQDVRNAFDFYLQQQVDGIFTDFPQSLARYLDLLYANTSTAPCTTTAFYFTFVVVAISVVIVTRCPFTHQQPRLYDFTSQRFYARQQELL